MFLVMCTHCLRFGADEIFVHALFRRGVVRAQAGSWEQEEGSQSTLHFFGPIWGQC